MDRKNRNQVDEPARGEDDSNAVDIHNAPIDDDDDGDDNDDSDSDDTAEN